MAGDRGKGGAGTPETKGGKEKKAKELPAVPQLDAFWKSLVPADRDISIINNLIVALQKQLELIDELSKEAKPKKNLPQKRDTINQATSHARFLRDQAHQTIPDCQEARLAIDTYLAAVKDYLAKSA